MVLYCTSYMNASLLYNLIQLEYGGCMPYINKFYFYNSNMDNVTCVHESLTTSLRYHHNLQQQWQLIAQQTGSMDGLDIMMYCMLLHYFTATPPALVVVQLRDLQLHTSRHITTSTIQCTLMRRCVSARANKNKDQTTNTSARGFRQP